MGDGEADLAGGLRTLLDRGYRGLVAIEGTVPREGRAAATRNLERTDALLAS